MEVHRDCVACPKSHCQRAEPGLTSHWSHPLVHVADYTSCRAHWLTSREAWYCWISHFSSHKNWDSCFLIDKKWKQKRTDWNPLLNFFEWLNWHNCLAQRKWTIFKVLIFYDTFFPIHLFFYLLFYFDRFLGCILKSPRVKANLACLKSCIDNLSFCFPFLNFLSVDNFKRNGMFL